MNIEEIDKWLKDQYGISYTEMSNEFNSASELLSKKRKENEKLNNIINELEKYIHNELILDFYDDNMPCELIINKMENMIKELKGSNKE